MNNKFYKYILDNPYIVHHIINEYCKGRTYVDIRRSVHKLFDIKVCEGTISKWLEICKRAVDIDKLKNRQFITMKRTLEICEIIKGNKMLERKNTEYMKRRILKISRLKKNDIKETFINPK